MAPKRRSFSMEDKLKLFSEIDRSPEKKKSHWAREFNLPSSTLCTILNNRKVIEESAMKMQGRLSSRKKWKSSPFEDVEMVLLEWIKQCSALNVPFNGCIIREKALLVAPKFGRTHFSASNGWLDRFKRRYGIVYAAKKSIAPYSDPSMTAPEWMNEKLQGLIEGYESKDIYNADETGLFYNLLIEKSCHDMEDYQDFEDRDDRITVLLCTNSDGSDKLPPLIIGKARLPHGFKNFKTLPCKYVKNRNAWLTTTVFQDYLLYIDSEMEAAGRKILLFIDHCAAHPSNIQLKNVKLLFFPSSCSEEVQPLSVGVINSFKQGYRKTFDHNVELMKERHGPTSQNVELIEALQFVVLSWDEVSPAVIRNCFYRVSFPMLNINEIFSEDDSPDSAKTIDPKNKIPTCGVLTLDEICDQILSNKTSSGNGDKVTSDMGVSFEESDHKTENSQDADYEVDEKNVSASDASLFENFQKDGYHAENEGAQSGVKLMDDGMDKNPPDFEEALSGFKKYKKYVSRFNVDEDIQNTLLLMEIALYKLHNLEVLRC